jgi:hypothetical protein
VFVESFDGSVDIVHILISIGKMLPTNIKNITLYKSFVIVMPKLTVYVAVDDM